MKDTHKNETTATNETCTIESLILRRETLAASRTAPAYGGTPFLASRDDLEINGDGI
jgi:hypothetical protein